MTALGDGRGGPEPGDEGGVLWWVIEDVGELGDNKGAQGGQDENMTLGVAR